ncbi:hypothetical protein XENORESO_005226, partial [Xenotaenia resolanae]
LVQVGPFQNGAKRHDGGVSVPPIWVFDVLLDEGQNVGNHIVFATGGQQHQTHACSLAGVPVIVVVVLGLGQDGDQVLQRSFRVELTGVLRGASLLRGLPLAKRKQEEMIRETEIDRVSKKDLKHTSEASMARSISSSQTFDQNSIPCRATSSMSLFIASMVI